MKYALINKYNEVINYIILKDDNNWICPPDHYVIKADRVEIGDIYNKEQNIFEKKKELE